MKYYKDIGGIIFFNDVNIEQCSIYDEDELSTEKNVFKIFKKIY